MWDREWWEHGNAKGVCRKLDITRTLSHLSSSPSGSMDCSSTAPGFANIQAALAPVHQVGIPVDFLRQPKEILKLVMSPEAAWPLWLTMMSRP